jgi:hypothetical protein
MPDRRSALFDLWTSYRFQLDTLAREAKVSQDTVTAMLCNKPVAKDEAKKVLLQLSTILHQECSLSTVYVSLVEEKETINPQSEVAALRKQIELEYDAGRRAIHDFSLGGTRHQFITQRMENMYKKVEALSTTIGEEAAIQLRK